MLVHYKKNGQPAVYDSNTIFIAKPLDGPEIPQGPFDKCTGCPYPRHGFICWGKDGDCLKTDLQKFDDKRNRHV